MSEKVVVKASMSSDELRAIRQQIREMETQAREREKEQRAEYRQAVRDFGVALFNALGVETAEQVRSVQSFLFQENNVEQLKKTAGIIAETENHPAHAQY